MIKLLHKPVGMLVSVLAGVPGRPQTSEHTDGRVI
jgi:hypothetical protein